MAINKDAVFYVCSLVEFTARKTKNHRSAIVQAMQEKGIEHYLEYADVNSIFKQPLHPYTSGLLRSIPSPTDKKDTLFSIKGSIPSPKDYPAGCRFSPRCEDCMEICAKKAPPLVTLEDGRKVRCWKYAKEAE